MRKVEDRLLAPVLEGAYAVVKPKHGVVLLSCSFDGEGNAVPERQVSATEVLPELIGKRFASLKVVRREEFFPVRGINVSRLVHECEAIGIGQFGDVDIAPSSFAFAYKPREDEGNYPGGYRIASKRKVDKLPLEEALLLVEPFECRRHFLYVGDVVLLFFEQMVAAEASGDIPGWSPSFDTLLQVLGEAKMADILREVPSAAVVCEKRRNAAKLGLAKVQAELKEYVQQADLPAVRQQEILQGIARARAHLAFYDQFALFV